MRTTFTTIGALVLVAACGESPASPPRAILPAPSISAATGAHVGRVREERLYSDTTTTCEGDLVSVTGTAVRREQVEILPTGAVRSTIHWTIRMRGTVLGSGALYVGELSVRQVHMSWGPDSEKPPIETRTIRLHGVTQGPSDNQFETLTFETVYGDGGGWTIVIRGKATCPG